MRVRRLSLTRERCSKRKSIPWRLNSFIMRRGTSREISFSKTSRTNGTTRCITWSMSINLISSQSLPRPKFQCIKCLICMARESAPSILITVRRVKHHLRRAGGSILKWLERKGTRLTRGLKVSSIGMPEIRIKHLKVRKSNLYLQGWIKRMGSAKGRRKPLNMERLQLASA
jgi:hypothetical protein